MRSQFRFYMHPRDEDEFVHFVLSEEGVVLVHGSNWSQPNPPVVESLREVKDYSPILIWAPAESPPLTATRTTWDGGEYWNCTSEYLAIQFLRSAVFRETVLTEGRIAVATELCPKPVARSIEERYQRLWKWLKARYLNSVIRWRHDQPDNGAWVGPHALEWVTGRPDRGFRQTWDGPQAELTGV